MFALLEKLVFFLYIFLLPFNTLFLNEKLHKISESLSFYPHVVGTVLMLITFFINKKSIKLKPNKILVMCIIFILILCFSDLLMAIFLNNELGILFGRDTYTAVFPHLIYKIQLIIILIYNQYILSKFGVSRVFKIIVKSIICLVIIGLIQVLALASPIGVIGTVELYIQNLIGFNNSYTQIQGRVNLVTFEASFAGAIISIFILPFSYVLFRFKKINTSLYIILMITVLLIIFYTKSTSSYIGLILFVLTVLMLRMRKLTFRNIWLTLITLGTIVILVSLNFGKIVQSEIFNIGIAKIVDLNNGSTLHRSSSIFTNFMAFLDYPLLGVGNGNQGFFYIKYLPDWAFSSYESRGYYYGYYGWPGAGAFLPQFISGYGLVGLTGLIILVYNIRKQIVSVSINNEGIFIKEILIISGIAFLFQSYSTVDVFGTYYLIFILSLALRDYNIVKKEKPEKL